MDYKILLAEDDKDIANILALYLKNCGYDILVAKDGKEAYDLIKDNHIDLALLDVMMPKLDGFSLAKMIRKDYDFPIIFLTARGAHEDKIVGLDCGADDYIEKPFNPMEVIARIKANLRRCYDMNGIQNSKNISYGGLTMLQDKMSVEVDGKIVPLTVTEYKILNALVGKHGELMTKKMLCQILYGDDYVDTDVNSISVHISNLRSKIEENPSEPEHLINIRGVGYKIESI